MRHSGTSTSLTPREREVAAQVAAARSNREIASRSGTSEHTVKKQVSAILAKLELSNRTQLALYVNRHQETAA